MLKKLSVLTILSLLTACGGGGSSSDTPTETKTSTTPTGSGASASTVSDSKSLSFAAAEIVKRAIASEKSPNILRGMGASASTATADMTHAMQKRSAFSVRADEYEEDDFGLENGETQIPGDCGGMMTMTMDTNVVDEENPVFPAYINMSFTYEDFCQTILDDYQVVVNGSGLVKSYATSEDAYTSTMSYMFEFDSNYPSEVPGVVSESITCVKKPGVEEVCDTASVYEDESGEDYTFNDVDVQGDDENGYNITGTLVDEAGNTFELIATALKFCENGNIESGELQLLVNNTEEVAVVFSNCDEFVVTYDGMTETYSQN